MVEQTGKIRIIDLATGTIKAMPFLDLSGNVSTVGEEGLLGLAFDRNYANDGRFFGNYVAPGGFFGQGVTRISVFTVSSNPDMANLYIASGDGGASKDAGTGHLEPMTAPASH